PSRQVGPAAALQDSPSSMPPSAPMSQPSRSSAAARGMRDGASAPSTLPSGSIPPPAPRYPPPHAVYQPPGARTDATVPPGAVRRFARWVHDYFVVEEPRFWSAIVPLIVLAVVLFARSPATNYIFDEQEALLANPYVNKVGGLR